MNEITIEPVSAEPEECIEAALCTLLSANCTIPVEGAMTPVAEGDVKALSSDTFVSVVVDQTSQDLDFRGSRVPCSYQARITVRFSVADDPEGDSFRDECRIVRAVLASLTGDGCDALTGDAFACDAFIINSTSTSFDGGANPSNTKTYTATLKGRINHTTEAN